MEGGKRESQLEVAEIIQVDKRFVNDTKGHLITLTILIISFNYITSFVFSRIISHESTFMLELTRNW